MHFGLGGEDDYIGLSAFLKTIGEYKCDIFPGISYAYINFSEDVSSEKLIAMCQLAPIDEKVFYCSAKFPDRERVIFFIQTHLKIEELRKGGNFDIPNAKYSLDIPGMEVTPNFLTLEEQDAVFAECDKHEWK